MYSKHKYFIFDLDGTLAYTIDDLLDCINLMLDTYGFPHKTLADAYNNINSGSHVFVRGCLPEEKQNDEAFVEEAHRVYLGFYSRNYLNKTRLYPGIAEGIAYMRSQGAEMAVYSNKDDAQTKSIIAKLFPEGTFKTALGYTGQFHHKPNADGAIYLAGLLGAKPEDVVVVGDSNIDMELAANAGMHSVGVSWGYRPKELLESLGAELILESKDDFYKLI